MATKSIISSILIAVGLLAGCGKSTTDIASSSSPGPVGAPTISNEPVTFHYLCSGSPADCNALLEKAKVSANLPNVTIESENLTNLGKALNSGWIPDLVNVVPSGLYTTIDAGLAGDMTPLLKKYNYDLSVFPKEQLDSIRQFDSKGGLIAVPQSPKNPYNWYGLDYNKDIFDKFALPYPKDNMTWEDVIALGKKLTRSDGGINYTGLVIDQPHELVLQRGLNFSDNSGKVTMDDPKWKEIFDLLKSAHDATGMKATYNLDAFYKLKTIAMYAGNQVGIISNHNAVKDFNWDIVTFPRFSDMKEPTLPPASGVFSIPPTSKHQDIAFALMRALQNDPAMVADDLGRYEGDIMATKHIASLKDQKTSVYTPERYFGIALPLFRAEINDMYSKNLDSNTAIMQLKEQIAAGIAKAKN